MVGTTVLSKTVNSLTMSANATSTTASAVCTQFKGEIRYQMIGLLSRTMVVQWKNTRSFGVNNQNYNFQIRLNESNNSIDIVYGDCNFASLAASPGPQVGLRGNNNTDFNNRTTSVTNWNTTTAGLVSNATLAILGSTTAPVLGRTYTWTPPPPSSIDIKLNAFISPGISCGNALQTVTVQLKNEGLGTHNFVTNPTNITVNVTGAITATVNATVNTGNLVVNGTLNVNCTPTFDMSANGTYNFALCSRYLRRC